MGSTVGKPIGEALSMRRAREGCTDNVHREGRASEKPELPEEEGGVPVGGSRGEGLEVGAQDLGSPSAMMTPRWNQTCFGGIPRLMRETCGTQKAIASGW